MSLMFSYLKINRLLSLQQPIIERFFYKFYTMKKGNRILQSVIILLMIGATGCTYYERPGKGGGSEPEPLPDPAFIGSDQCALCHQEIYNDFSESGHPFILSKVEDGTAPERPFTSMDYTPPYFQNDWNDISYAVGGFAWKYQFLDNDGFVYTGNDAQYNFLDNSVSAYHDGVAPGTEIYDCGKCHTTGWKSITDGGSPQDGLAGMGGEFFAEGVQCEACHGMANRHVLSGGDKTEISVDPNATACAQCHYGNEDHSIAAADGFIVNHAQFDEMTAAGHKDLSCIDCHNPHASVKHGQTDGITATCTDCHTDMNNPTHNGADCLTCHMPYATKSGSMVNKYVADMKTHIFKINPAEDGEMFNEDGTIAIGSTGVTLDYVCYQCHRDSKGVGGDKSIKTLKSLSTKATGYHD